MKTRIKQLAANLLVTLLIIGSTSGVLSAAADGAAKRAEFAEEDTNATYDRSTAVSIKLSGDTATIQGNGATVQGSTVRITKAGTYILDGTLNNGQIIVEAGNKANVQLVLANAAITNKSSSAIYVSSAKKVIITISAGTKNTLVDSANYVFAAGADEPDAVIFSKDDLTINGTGTLTVQAQYKHGIVGKDEVRVVSATVNINSVGDGIKGTDMIAIKSGKLTIHAQGDGMQSSKGYVDIQGGVIVIQSDADGIQAETDLLINGGTISITAGGGSANVSYSSNANQNPFNRFVSSNKIAQDDEASAKGLKAEVNININEGNISVDSLDDAIHSNNNIVQNGGTLNLSTGDDGIHADATFVANGGMVTITKSYEGIESASLTFNDGVFYITSYDDGINATLDQSEADFDTRFRQPGTPAGGTGATLALHGGYIYVDANGDGIDINGSIEATGGTLIVCGPTVRDNSAFDYDGEFNIQGGFFVATGSSQMAQIPSSSSNQPSLAVTLSTVSPGTIVHIGAENGAEILTFKSTKSFQSLIVSSPLIKDGVSYAVYVGGSHTGVLKDGLYSQGAYSLGNKVTTITTATNNNMGAGGFGGRGGRPGW